MKKIMVYGTLRKGWALNPYLNAFKFVGNATLSGYDMYSNGYFPMIVEGKGTVKGEVYEIENGINEIEVLDRIESAYNRTKVEAKIDGAWIEVEVYVWKHDTKGLAKIESGDWGKQNE